MPADFDLKLTELAADVLRDAVRVYGPREGERLLVGFNPVLTTGVPVGLDATGSLSAVVGSLPTPSETGSSAASGATSAFKAVTSQFRAITESFRAVGPEPAEPAITLRSVFRLPDRLPGVQLPAEAELGAMARSAPTMARLDALARWLGRDGRLLTGTDDLTAADAADAARQLGTGPVPLSFLWEYALTSRWFELADSPDRRRTWVMVGDTAWRWANGDDQGALHVWAAVFAAVLAGTLEVTADADPEAARTLNFQGQGPALAVTLFLARRSGMTARDVQDLVRKGAIGERPPPRLRRAWDTWVRQHGDPAQQLLVQLAELRAVILPGTAGAAVQLTPLALWALREQFALDKISVPQLTPASSRMSAANLVALSDAVSEAEFGAAYAAWMSGRDPDRAVRELLIYAGSASPQARLTAVTVARRIGVPGYGAWQDALPRPELRGYARITLSLLAAGRPQPAPAPDLASEPDDMAGLAADLLALACGADDPDPDEIAAQFAEAVPAPVQDQVLRLMASSPAPEVTRLLGVLSDYHPDRRVARAARKAARASAKHRRSAGGHRVPAGTASG